MASRPMAAHNRREARITGRIMMRFRRFVYALLPLAAVAQPVAASSAAAVTPALDFEFFKARIEPIFTTKRPGHARCISCHGDGTTMKLTPLPEGSATWTEAEARANFDVISKRVVP